MTLLIVLPIYLISLIFDKDDIKDNENYRSI